MRVESSEGLEGVTQATKAGDWVFVAGRRSEDRDGRVIGTGDFGAQAEAAFESVGQALRAAGASLSDIVKITAYLVNPTDMEVFHEICNQVFCTKRPAGTRVAVSSLVDPDALVEIEACARLGRGDGKDVVRSNSRTGAFAEGVRCGDTVLISGQTAEGSADFCTQLYGVYGSISAALAKLGVQQKDLVKINYFISNPLYYRELYRIREEVFEVDWPGDSVVSVRALDTPGALVECDAVALVPPAKAEFVNTPELPPPFNFSNVVVADGLAYVSGQVARDRHKNLILPGDFEAQFRQGLQNVEIALESVGCSFDDAVKVSCFISHAGYLEESLRIGREVFGARAPAVTSVAVDSMGGFPEALCEIDAIAAVSQ